MLLTAVTQIGGIAWLASRGFRWPLVAFAALYTALWMAAVAAAPLAGRTALPCFGEPLRLHSPAYCLTLRHFATPELAQVAEDVAAQVATIHPGTVTLALDSGFPFWSGFPLLPHLSHDDGGKLDFALFYSGPPGKTPSPIGYWAFPPTTATCPRSWPTLRWNMGWLQPLWPDWPIDRARTRTLVLALAEDRRIGKILLEPTLTAQLNLSHPKIRFQGCRAARHDDHIHVQL